jgi:hypothetical protein
MADPEFIDFTRPKRYGRFVDTGRENQPGFIKVFFRPSGFRNMLFGRIIEIPMVPKGSLVGPLTGPDYPPDGLYILIRSEGGYTGCIENVVQLMQQRLPELEAKNISLELKAATAAADRELSSQTEKEKLAELRERMDTVNRPKRRPEDLLDENY